MIIQVTPKYNKDYIGDAVRFTLILKDYAFPHIDNTINFLVTTGAARKSSRTGLVSVDGCKINPNEELSDKDLKILNVAAAMQIKKIQGESL